LVGRLPILRAPATLQGAAAYQRCLSQSDNN
jgi:hypothetical protein